MALGARPADRAVSAETVMANVVKLEPPEHFLVLCHEDWSFPERRHANSRHGHQLVTCVLEGFWDFCKCGCTWCRFVTEEE